MLFNDAHADASNITPIRPCASSAAAQYQNPVISTIISDADLRVIYADANLNPC